jgi:hypothetical protein
MLVDKGSILPVLVMVFPIRARIPANNIVSKRLKREFRYNVILNIAAFYQDKNYIFTQKSYHKTFTIQLKTERLKIYNELF